MGTDYSHLTAADRMSIQALLQAKLSCRAIARQLSLNHSSITREINRGKLHPTAQACGYQAGAAHLRCRARRAGAGAARRKLGADMQTPLWRMVLSGLRCHWSPEQIAGKQPGMNNAVPLADRAVP